VDRRQQQRFHGLFDTVAELDRMREFWRAGVDPPQESRTHSTAWIPRMDIFAQGDDLVAKAYYVRERQYGGFRRTINLPEGTERSGVTALLQDGLLEITVAGGCAVRRHPERIDISVSGGERG
jgi:HSP20 family protein